MINGAVLLVIAVIGAANGLGTSGGVSLWRAWIYLLLAVVAYLHGRRLRVRYGGPVLIAVAVLTTGTVFINVWEAVSALASLSLVVILPWLTGQFRLQQVELLIAERHQVTQLEREQQFVAERARARERARIATDMHDSLGHELALVAVRAGALELAPNMTESNRRAAEQLRDSAVRATERLRETIGMLREVPTALIEPPDETIETLVERATNAGMTVQLHRTGQPTELPSLVDRAAHRVAQEALTNAARYAPGAEVTVVLAHTAEALKVTVTNTAARDAPAHVSGSGSGLLGLHERVRLLGGTLRAQPCDGGFEVAARLPIGEHDKNGLVDPNRS